MAFKRLSMRKIHRVLRLFFEAGLSIRAIARSIEVSPSTVGEYIRRANTAGLSWPLPETLDERALDGRLFPAATVSARVERPIPDWSRVHAERRRNGVTLALLWQEYKAEHPEGLQYSQFCERYRRWRGRLDVVMRQSHRAGEKLFVDYAGHNVSIVDPTTGEVRKAQLFVAVLGASNYTFAEATWTQALPDWCASHVRALSFLQGVPEIVVPDNLRSAVSRPHRYEPDAHPTYTDLAEHYGFAIVPARVRRPPRQVSRFILRSLWHVRSGFSVTPGFPAVFLRRVGVERGIEIVGLVVVGRRPKPSLVAPIFDGGDSHTEFRGDLLAGQVAGLAQSLIATLQPIGEADPPHHQPMQSAALARAHAAFVEDLCDLLVGVMRDELVDGGNDLRTGLSQRPRRQRPSELERLRGATAEAHVNQDLVGSLQRHVLDQQPQHAFALARRRVDVVPELGEVRAQGKEFLAFVLVEDELLALALLLVALPRVLEPAQLLIPVRLQRVGHQSMVRIDPQVAAPGQLGLVLRALDRLVAKLVGALELRLELPSVRRRSAPASSA